MIGRDVKEKIFSQHDKSFQVQSRHHLKNILHEPVGFENGTLQSVID